jgi:hypothetical protein
MRGGGRWNRKERNGSQGRMGLVGEIQSGCTAGSRHHSRFAQALKASKTRSRIAREIGGFELRERLRKLRWASSKQVWFRACKGRELSKCLLTDRLSSTRRQTGCQRRQLRTGSGCV